MAPPTSTLPLGDRLKALAQTLQYVLLFSVCCFFADTDGV